MAQVKEGLASHLGNLLKEDVVAPFILFQLSEEGIHYARSDEHYSVIIVSQSMSLEEIIEDLLIPVSVDGCITEVQFLEPGGTIPL